MAPRMATPGEGVGVEDVSPGRWERRGAVVGEWERSGMEGPRPAADAERAGLMRRGEQLDAEVDEGEEPDIWDEEERVAQGGEDEPCVTGEEDNERFHGPANGIS